MIEILKIITRIIYGLLPLMWVVSMWFYNEKRKFETATGITTIALLFIGIIECIFTAIGV